MGNPEVLGAGLASSSFLAVRGSWLRNHHRPWTSLWLRICARVLQVQLAKHAGLDLLQQYRSAQLAYAATWNRSMLGGAFRDSLQALITHLTASSERATQIPSSHQRGACAAMPRLRTRMTRSQNALFNFLHRQFQGTPCLRAPSSCAAILHSGEFTKAFFRFRRLVGHFPDEASCVRSFSLFNCVVGLSIHRRQEKVKADEVRWSPGVSLDLEEQLVGVEWVD